MRHATVFALMLCFLSPASVPGEVAVHHVAPAEARDYEKPFAKSFKHKKLTIRVAEGERQSDGSFIVQVYDDGLFADGRIGSCDGAIVDAWLADLDHDGSPEIVFATRCTGSGSYGNLVAYTLRDDGTLKTFKIPLTGSEITGYSGHDQFKIEGNSLTREYPLYKSDDPNCCPTGGNAKFQFDPAKKKWTRLAPK